MTSFPFDIHAFLAETQHDDCQLDRFYNICMFPKPPTAPPRQNIPNQKQPRFNPNANNNPVDIGTDFFDGLLIYNAVDQLIPLFIRLYNRLPEYLKNHSGPHNSRHIMKAGLNFHQFFFQCFLLYLKTLRDRERARVREAAAIQRAQAALSKSAEDGKPKVVQPAVNAEIGDEFQILDEQRYHIFYLIVRLEFPSRVKVWSLLATAGMTVVDVNSKFPEIVKEATETGAVAFWAVRYAIIKFPLIFDDILILVQVLMLGRITGHLIEEFLAERSEEDRGKARRLLLQAENWGTSQEAYFNAVINAGRHPQGVLSFEEFSNNMVDLMIELRREMPRCNLISIPWAYRAIKDYFEKVYVKNEWTTEQLYDLIFTIITQRPNLRHGIVQEFKKYKDQRSADYWRNFVLDRRFPQFHASMLGNKLNIPPRDVYPLPGGKFNMYEEREDFLSIPEGVDVFVIDQSAKLKVIEFEILKCAKSKESDYAVLGLDAEWSPYVATSRAQILQIAFRKSVYIVDLDAIQDVNFCLTQFMDKLFSDEQVLKIGFHFSEDLNQLRKKVPNAWGLYVPANLICISKLVGYLLNASSEAADFDVNEFIVVEKLQRPKPAVEQDDQPSLDSTQDSVLSEEAAVEPVKAEEPVESVVETTVDSIPEAEEGKAEENPQKAEEKPKQKMKNYSLSTLCGAILGKPLDKMEQCSDWARRPIRMNQCRYAALDAYCQLMIYDRCAAWAAKLGLDIVQITDAQDRISSPLPLFFDQSKMRSGSGHAQ